MADTKDEQIAELRRLLDLERATHLQAMRDIVQMNCGVTSSGYVPVQLREAWRDVFVSVKRTPTPTTTKDIVTTVVFLVGLVTVAMAALWYLVGQAV
jgi:hypothetical protein